MAVPAKRSFAEAIVSASDAIDAMGKLIDDTDGKYTDADIKKDVKLVLRELHSFRKGTHVDVLGTRASISFTQGGSAAWEVAEREAEAGIAKTTTTTRICGARDVL